MSWLMDKIKGALITVDKALYGADDPALAVLKGDYAKAKTGLEDINGKVATDHLIAGHQNFKKGDYAEAAVEVGKSLVDGIGFQIANPKIALEQHLGISPKLIEGLESNAKSFFLGSKSRSV